MKKQILLLLLLLINMSVIAQDNHKVAYYHGTVEYKKPSALSTLGGLAMLAEEKTQTLGLEDKSIVPTLVSAIEAAPSEVYRLVVRSEERPSKTEEEAYTLNVVLSNVMTFTGKDNGARATIEMTLVDLCKNKTVATGKTFGIRLAPSENMSKDEAVASLAEELNKEVRQFLWSYFPISGTIVQKGVEQNNGKVKEKQCYIDLAENYGAFEGMRLIAYIDNNGKLKEIGSLKIKEVAGEELSICTITKGNSKIEKALEQGEKLVVMTKTPKE